MTIYRENWSMPAQDWLELMDAERVVQVTLKPISEPWHGTVSGYTNHKCRCVDCREAQAAYMRELRRKG